MQQGGPRSVTLPTFFEGQDPERLPEHVRKIADAVNSMLNGKTNNTFVATLDAGETSTDVLFSPCHLQSVVTLTAQTASASLSTGVWVEPKKGKVTIHHESDSATDRRFGLVISG